MVILTFTSITCAHENGDEITGGCLEPGTKYRSKIYLKVSMNWAWGYGVFYFILFTFIAILSGCLYMFLLDLYCFGNFAICLCFSSSLSAG